MQKKLFSQTKTYFCYFNITFEMSHIVVFLVFCVLNTKYLPFRIHNASTLILNWLRIFIFYFKILFLLSFWVLTITSWAKLITREGVQVFGRVKHHSRKKKNIYIYITIFKKRIFIFFFGLGGGQFFFSFFFS